MTFSARKFVLCLLIYPFWLSATQWVPVSQSIEQSDSLLSDEAFSSSMEQVLRDLSDILFVNSGCRCEGNDGCKRGCRFESSLSRHQSPLIRKCTNPKPISRSSANCARHVTGAIMAVIHELLLDHCKNTEDGIFKDKIGYDQCVDNFHKDVADNNINICRHGFKFEHAFCMLNLDGQSTHMYESIPDEDGNIKQKCKRWDPYNQFLLTLNTSSHSGKITAIPLFKKISSKRYKEFQNHPGKIPNGAIVITKLRRSDGHVEVKTDRNECGKDKNQTCFCSDYCTKRSAYTHPILAVFEWNPDFIEYANKNYYDLDFL